jgi:hypothetical protein
MIPAEIATKLAKIIPRLATEHEGEVINAVGAISRILVGAGLDWHVLAKVIKEAGSPETAPFDWSEVADFDPDQAAPPHHREPKPDPDAPDAPSRRGGLPIWGVKKIEPWWVIAEYCLQMDWTLPKAFGGKSLTKADKDRLRAVQKHGPVTNADADWIESIVARCHAARDAWRARDQKAAA